MKSWYLLMTKPKQEALAQTHLENQGYKVFCPVMRIVKSLRGKQQSSMEPLFPRYLFIELDDINQDWSPIRSTKGVLQMVRFGRNWAKVDIEIVESLRQREAMLEQSQQNQTLFKPGEKLRVTSGPFYGLEAEFERMDQDQRVVALMNVLGQSQALTLDLKVVERK